MKQVIISLHTIDNTLTQPSFVDFNNARKGWTKSQLDKNKNIRNC